MYREAVAKPLRSMQTTLVLVARPEKTPLLEAERSSGELLLLGINNQLLVINGVSGILYRQNVKIDLQAQQNALAEMPASLGKFKIYSIPLRSYTFLALPISGNC